MKYTQHWFLRMQFTKKKVYFEFSNEPQSLLKYNSSEFVKLFIYFSYLRLKQWSAHDKAIFLMQYFLKTDKHLLCKLGYSMLVKQKYRLPKVHLFALQFKILYFQRSTSLRDLKPPWCVSELWFGGTSLSRLVNYVSVMIIYMIKGSEVRKTRFCMGWAHVS